MPKVYPAPEPAKTLGRNGARAIMEERSPRLACNLAIWISLLFCSASSMARLRVRDTAFGAAFCGGGASWANAGSENARNIAAPHTNRLAGFAQITAFMRRAPTMYLLTR